MIWAFILLVMILILAGISYHAKHDMSPDADGYPWSPEEYGRKVAEYIGKPREAARNARIYQYGDRERRIWACKELEKLLDEKNRRQPKAVHDWPGGFHPTIESGKYEGWPE